MPFAATPDLARPDPGLVTLLGAVAARPDTEVHVVSGRAPRGPRPLAGASAGVAPCGAWVLVTRAGLEGVGPRRGAGGSWREPVLAILRDITARTPGSLIETKAAAIGWHYRMADPEIGARRANELRLHLNQVLSNQPVEILPGHRLLEIRPYGIHKGRIVAQLSSERLAGTAVGSRSATIAPMRISSPRSHRRRSRSGWGQDPHTRGSGSTASMRCARCCRPW